MKKIWISEGGLLFNSLRKPPLSMRLSLAILFVGLLQVSASTYSQNTPLTLKLENASIKQLFNNIKEHSEFTFVYNDDDIENLGKISVNVSKSTVEEILDHCLAGTGMTFEVRDKVIIIVPKEEEESIPEKPEEISQERLITGKVTDENGNPLPGVSIQAKGTGKGTITDAEGNYTIEISDVVKTLIFSFVGMVKQEVEVFDQTTINIVMLVDAIGMEEVVTVGYGTQKKIHLTGAVGLMNSDDLEKRTATDVRQALQGNIPGLTIIDRGGPPGSEWIDFKIRGVGTIGNAQPLVLVDGIQQSLSSVDSDDIESISVLKDASSAAIYGARAANGVVLITTKRANKKELLIEYDGYYGLQKPALRQDFLDAREYLELINESLINAGQSPRYSADYINRTVQGDDPNYPYTDGWNELIGFGDTHDHSIRFMNGGEKTNTYFSMNYVDQTGILQKANQKRYIFTLNNTFHLSEKIKLYTDVKLLSKNYQSPRDYGIGWALGDPLVTYKYPNGLYGFNTKNGISPLAHLEASGDNKQSVLNISPQFKLEYNIFEGLKLEAFAGYLLDVTKRSVFTPSAEFPDPNNPEDILLKWEPSSISEGRGETIEQTYRFIFDYKRSLNNHNIGILGGYEQIENNWSDVYAYREKLYNNNFRQLSLGDPATSTNSSGAADWALRSYFGRVTYNFGGKYLVESSLRYDGSSRFAEGNKWGIFPAASVGWVLSKESFMESINGLNLLKLRASYGSLGNQNIGLFKYVSSVSSGWDYTFGGALVPGYNSSVYANTDITWEETTTLNLGADFILLAFGGNIDATFDWYNKTTDDILLTLPIPRIVGLWPSETNAGIVKNQGWEFSLFFRNYSGELGYKLGLNLSDVKNVVVDLAGLSPIISSYTILQEGYPIWAAYGWQSDGLFVDQDEIDSSPRQPNSANIKPGDIKFVDRDGNGVVDDEDRYVMGSNIPRYEIGFNMQFEFKGFDLVAFFQGALKSQIYLKGGVNDGPQFQNAATIRFSDRWTPDDPNPDAAMPRITANQNYNNTYNNDFWLRDAKYLRLKNIQLGYNLPKGLINKIGVRQLRMFISGTNVFTITPLEAGLDPEIDNGWSAGGYPTLSTYSIGMNIKF